MGVPLGWVWFPIRRFSGALCLCFSANSSEKGFLDEGVKISLAILGTTRALFLFVDPYSSGENGVEIPRWLSRLVYGIAFPSLTSSFCLIHLAFLDVTKIKLGSKKLQSARFVGSVIVSHFALEIWRQLQVALNTCLNQF